MKNTFLKISLGTGIILLSGGFFIRSFQTAKAESKISMPVFPTEGKFGKFMMNYECMNNANGDNEYNILVWDTETGKSSFYYLDFSNKKWSKSFYQLPESPVE